MEAIESLKESKKILRKFSSKEETIEFLVKEIGSSKEECTSAYDFLIKLDLDKQYFIEKDRRC